MNKQWYQELFEDYAETYDNENFVQGTAGECDFLEEEIKNKDIKILDVGCGTGRHSIELTKRGFSVVGIDLSEGQLKRAKLKAEQENLNIDFQKHDAGNLPFNSEFDVAIMLCEGGFPLMETDEKNFKILKSVSKSLKSKAKFIFTTLNGLFPVFNSIEAFCAAEKEDGNAEYRNNKFDYMTFRDYNVTTLKNDSGKELVLNCNERYYIPPEITWLLKSVGFTKIEIFGAKVGAYSRNDKLTKDDFEMLVIAER